MGAYYVTQASPLPHHGSFHRRPQLGDIRTMAGANRLQLDFKLVTTDERAAFLEEYLQQPQFVKKPPTPDELETMGN